MAETITLRPYQVDCKSSIKKHFDKGVTKQLIVEATGLGKRFQAVDLIQHFGRALFIAHREELIGQAYDEIEQFHPFEVGIIKGPRFEIDKRIVVASVQTLYNRLDRIPADSFDLVIVDEAHHYMAKSYIKSIRHFNAKLLTGWTATPNRLDGLNLSNLFEKVAFTYSISDGVKDGFLAKIDAYQIQTQGDLSKVKKQGGDFNQKQLSDAVDTELRNNLIVHKYKEYAEGRQGIAFCVDINHAYHLRDQFLEYGIVAEAIVSDTSRCPNRAELVERFQKGDIDVLTNVNILTEGFDYSDVGVVLAARPTQSEAVYVQQIGRGTRLKSQSFQEEFESDHCIVLDFVDNCGSHNLVNAHQLEKGKPIEERNFLPDEHREKLLEERQKREFKIKSRIEKDSQIDLLEIPDFKMGNWSKNKMEDMATDAQVDFLRKLNIYQEDTEYTKFQASEMISLQPASQWQLQHLAAWKYDISEGATMGQYQKIKQSRERSETRSKNKHAMKPEVLQAAIDRMRGQGVIQNPNNTK